MTDDAAFLHGGPDDGAPVRHDFSTNANACGPCPQVLAAVQRADAARYPDPRYTALRDRLAAFHGVAPGRVAIAASASEFIFRITAAVARRGARRVALPAHGYGDYARAARAWDLIAMDERIDAHGAASVADPPDLAWHCDPSSPLGQPVPALGDRIDALAPSTTCVLDLAYEPLRLDGTLGLTRARRDRVWQLWTPNKALGLTGVRAAYAIAPVAGGAAVSSLPHLPELADRVEWMAPSWAVGSHGVAMLDAWVDGPAQEWLAASRDILRDWKRRQQALCADLGWTVRPGVANFMGVEPGVGIGVRDIPAWVAALRAEGIKVRDASSFGLPGHCRLAVLSPASQDALRDAVLSPAFPRPASPSACRSRPLS